MDQTRQRTCWRVASIAIVLLIGVVCILLFLRTPRARSAPAARRPASKPATDPFAGIQGKYFRTGKNGRIGITVEGQKAMITAAQEARNAGPTSAEIYSDDPKIRQRAYEERMERVQEAFEEAAQGVAPDGTVIVPQTKALPPQPVGPITFPGSMPPAPPDGAS